MVDSFFTVFSVRRGGKKKTPQSLATAPHHSEMAAAIDQGESAVSYPVSTSSCSLHEAIQACRGLSRHHATVLSVQYMPIGCSLHPGDTFTKTHYESGVSRWLPFSNCYLPRKCFLTHWRVLWCNNDHVAWKSILNAALQAWWKMFFY